MPCSCLSLPSVSSHVWSPESCGVAFTGVCSGVGGDTYPHGKGNLSLPAPPLSFKSMGSWRGQGLHFRLAPHLQLYTKGLVRNTHSSVPGLAISWPCLMLLSIESLGEGHCWFSDTWVHGQAHEYQVLGSPDELRPCVC